MSCNEFRAGFHVGTNDQAQLRHLRTCDACLDFAAHIDADVIFRAIGGEEMVPPGGVDAFVGDVMHAVRLRGTEGTLAFRGEITWTRKLAIAAALAVGITGGSIVYQVERSQTTHPSQLAAVARPAARAAIQVPLTTKPVVQTYSSANATIVEVPNEGASDTQVVLIVDENLPADL
jgi:hypothetical protein